MNRAQAYLAKMLPVVPPVLDEIEESPFAGAAIADAVVRFPGRCLACEPHQLPVLALWVFYTRCFEHISTAVYLAVFRVFFTGMSRLLRNGFSIRNVIRNGFFRDWRSLSRLRGLRRLFYVPGLPPAKFHATSTNHKVPQSYSRAEEARAPDGLRDDIVGWLHSIIKSPNPLRPRGFFGAAITMSYPRSSAQIRGKFLFLSSVCISAFISVHQW